jgi:hypothetical protein
MKNKFLRRISILVVSLVPGFAMAQSTDLTTSASVSSQGTIVVDVFAPADADAKAPSHNTDPSSTAFTTSALKATAALKTWQRHLEYTIKHGYPPSELWMGQDHDQSADALNSAAANASTETERATVQQLASIHEYLRSWSLGFLQAYNQMRMAQYYMSPATLENDTNFQRAAACTDSLSVAIRSSQLSDAQICR